ncbi:Cilia- and flagella-associated protein 36 [Phytophthora citrophthora]|uniref:Cilia- and flagella-associated protein 36 n=1 Tax=Phytophthora citrophthora TaxID=4793 RepID=A0AAD9GL23_9STRA|nr:Cilia- and flagella-associated protein 36 [Phytophthora citrophthora]
MADALEFTSEESDWVFDYVLNLFRSPAWELPIMCFIDDNCASFDTDEENKFIYTELHLQFRELVETVLGSHLAEMGLTATDFATICEKQRDSERAAGCSVSDGVSADVVNQILAMDDFLSFKKLMVKRNLELELEAIKELREEVTEDEHDLEAQFMELSVLYKQEEMEQAELEVALAMSMVVQDEQLRLASVAAKVAEDKHASSVDTRQLSPAEVQQQIRESKKKAEEICKKNKESLEENRSKQREWQQAADISEMELKRREEYLKKQRDRIIEKKKREREVQLKEYQQEQKATAPEPPAQLAEKLQSNTSEEAKKAEEEERRNALRIALARRMKQDLLESANSAASDPSHSGSFKMHQVWMVCVLRSKRY